MSTATTCAVQDSEGHHCPAKPTHRVTFQGKTFDLCEGCFHNLSIGAYGSIHGKIDLNPIELKPKVRP